MLFYKLVIVAREKLLFVCLKGTILKGSADEVNGMDDKVLVVDTGEDFGGDFVGLEKMMEIGARVIFTTFAITVRLEGSKVVGIFGVFDVNAAVFSIE